VDQELGAYSEPVTSRVQQLADTVSVCPASFSLIRFKIKEPWDFFYEMTSWPQTCSAYSCVIIVAMCF